MNQYRICLEILCTTVCITENVYGNIHKILGGTRIFFPGIYLFTCHVRNISGIYLRKYVGKYTENGLSSFILGLLAGAVSTSAKLVTFTSAGFVLSGVINMRTARFIAVGSSIETISLILGA